MESLKNYHGAAESRAWCINWFIKSVAHKPHKTLVMFPVKKSNEGTRRSISIMESQPPAPRVSSPILWQCNIMKSEWRNASRIKPLGFDILLSPITIAGSLSQWEIDCGHTHWHYSPWEVKLQTSAITVSGTLDIGYSGIQCFQFIIICRQLDKVGGKPIDSLELYHKSPKALT